MVLDADTFLLNAMTCACKLRNDRVKIRLPITKSVLQLLVTQIPEIFSNQPFLAIMYETLFTTAYFGLFRIGELVESKHVVKAKDVHIAKFKSKLKFVLHTSKTHGWGDKPQIIKISSSFFQEN